MLPRVAFGELLVACLGLAPTACASPVVAPLHASTPELTEAFHGVQCNAVRPQTEPDLMAWDPGSRANLSRLRRQGVVAVRYVQEGCNVELELLSNCIGPGGAKAYEYSPYGETQSKLAKSAQQLFAELPIGAARLSGKLKGNRALRADYTLVGTAAVPPGTSYKMADLKGDCAGATHVVSVIYVGGFAMVAGEAKSLEASGSVFGASIGGSSEASAEALDSAGDAEACEKAKKLGHESAQCAVPLRIGLAKIADAVPPKAPPPEEAVPARMIEHDGVRFPDRVRVDGKNLVLNGFGTRKATFLRVKVYVGALYLETPSRDAEAISASRQVIRVHTQFTRDVDASSITKGMREGVERNCGASCGSFRAQEDQLISIVGHDVRSGDSLAYTFGADSLEVFENGVSRGRIPGRAISRAMLGAFIGPRVEDEGLRDALLGASR